MNSDPILYAEDEEDDAFFVQRAFKQAGIQNRVVVAPDGLQPMDYLSGTGRFANRAEYATPCLVLLDISMPGKSGLEVLKWIRSQPAICAMPVLMLTSSSQESDIHRAYIQGANGFLVKPGNHDELVVMARAIKDYWLVQNRTAADSRRFSESN